MNVTEHEYSLTGAAEEKFVRNVKEKLRYFSTNYDTVHLSTAKMDKEKFNEPHENFITVGAERFRCAEVLLLPEFIGEGAIGIHDTFFLSNMKCGVYDRRNLKRCFTGFLDYDTELPSNPTSSQTETSSFVSAQRKRFSSQSHWPPDSTTHFFLEQDAVVLSNGTTMF